MTKEALVAELATLPLEDMAWVRRQLQEMIYREAGKLHAQRTCKHPHIVEQRYGQREDQVHWICTTCSAKVG